jgi:hypothetical protein
MAGSVTKIGIGMTGRLFFVFLASSESVSPSSFPGGPVSCARTRGGRERNSTATMMVVVMVPRMFG